MFDCLKPSISNAVAPSVHVAGQPNSSPMQLTTTEAVPLIRIEDVELV
jgi:hypothetical protein